MVGDRTFTVMDPFGYQICFIRPLARSAAPGGEDCLRTVPMKKHVLAVLAYGVATFVTQSLSHFVVNNPHYAPSHICVLTRSFHSVSLRC